MKKTKIKKKKESKSEIKKEKKEKNLKKIENENNKNDKSQKIDNINKNFPDIPNRLRRMIDAVEKSNSRRLCPKIDGYSIFKKEYKQLNKGKDDERSENEVKNEWRNMPKELKKFYNINAEKQNKLIKESFNKIKSYKKF